MQRVLIINSSYETMHLLERWLERKRYDVKVTGDLDSVLDIIEDFRPDALLIDIDQDSVIPKIKDNVDMQSIPILMMTGFVHNIDKRTSIADDTIEKPFSLDLLQKKIETLITVET